MGIKQKLVAEVLVGLCLWLFVGLIQSKYAPNNHKTKSAVDKQETDKSKTMGYDIDKFVSAGVFGDTDNALQLLGDTAIIDDTLDFYGDTAKQYRYHSSSQPPFFAIESKNFLEIAWYYANSTDSDDDKKNSHDYAQKAYLATSSLVANSQDFFDRLLNTKSDTSADDTTQKPKQDTLQDVQIATKKSLDNLPKGVVFASCEHYMCQIIFEKSAFTHQRLTPKTADNSKTQAPKAQTLKDSQTNLQTKPHTDVALKP